ncbi:hypothetical protein HWV62_37109 [Athelia sp. TMB]|nr:hypothetical protein HWV62_37109 [Athelia sp. TMB]
MELLGYGAYGVRPPGKGSISESLSSSAGKAGNGPRLVIATVVGSLRGSGRSCTISGSQEDALVWVIEGRKEHSDQEVRRGKGEDRESERKRSPEVFEWLAFNTYFKLLPARLRTPVIMAPPEKIQGDEKSFLMSKFPAYLAAAAAGTYPAFWPQLFIDYFEQYPVEPAALPDLSEGVETEAPPEDFEEDHPEQESGGGAIDLTASTVAAKAWAKQIVKLRAMTEKEQKRWCLGRGTRTKKAQLRTWFRWRQNKMVSSRAPVASITALFAAKSKSGGRLLTQIEKYSKLYFPDRVRHLVADALLVYGDHPTRAQKLTTIKRITSEMWEDEDDDTKDFVLASMAADKAKREASLLNPTEEETARTPVQFQAAIDTLPPILKHVFDELAKTTGWAFTILMGGPSPEAGGNIVSATHHVGETAVGNDWGRVYRDFDANIISPYQEFLRHIFPSDVRRERALHLKESTKEPSLPLDMLPFHDNEELGNDRAGDDFLLDMFDESRSPSQEPNTTPAKSAPSSPGTRSPFNTFALNVESELHASEQSMEAPLITAVPGPVASFPTAPPSIAPQTPPSCDTESLAVVAKQHTPQPSPEGSSQRSPEPSVAAATPTPLASPAPPSILSTPLVRTTGSVTVASTVTTIQGQSSDARDRYLQLKSNAASGLAARKARLAAVQAEEDRQDAAQAKVLAEDVAEILALPKLTLPQAAAPSAQAKESALARLVLSRAERAKPAVRPSLPSSPTISGSQSVDTPSHEEARSHPPSSGPSATSLTTASSTPAKVSTPTPVMTAPTQTDVTAPESSLAVKPLTATQKAAAKRKEKAAEKALKKDADDKAKEEARVEREAAYAVEMRKLNAEQLIVDPFTIPTKAGPWVRPLIEALSAKDIGGQWRACLKAYVELLDNMGCEEMTATLSTVQRPSQIGYWIKSARKLQKPPELNSDYFTQWMRWWSALQPEWRHGDGKLPPALYVCDTGEWEGLRNSGKNGLAMVLLSVWWQGSSVGGNTPEWVAAVIDIRRTLEGMIQVGGKRTASSVTPASSAGSRKR